MKKINDFIAFSIAVIQIAFCLGCTDTQAQAAYSAPASNFKSTDAAHLQYKFEREQNRKVLDSAKCVLQKKNTKPIAPGTTPKKRNW